MYQNLIEIKTESDDSVTSEEEMPENEFILGTDYNAFTSQQSKRKTVPTFSQAANIGKKPCKTATIPTRFAENNQPQPDTFNIEAIGLLKSLMANQQKLLENQRNLQARMTTLEHAVNENMLSRAKNKIIQESNVVAEKPLKSVSRGTEDDKLLTDIATSWPLSSMEAAYNVEENLKKPDYLEAMISLVCKIKDAVGVVDGVFRKLMNDDLVRYFNWDGRWGKNSLVKFTLINSVLFEAFKDDGWNKFEIAMRKSVERSHNRSKQKRYAQKRHNP